MIKTYFKYFYLFLLEKKQQLRPLLSRHTRKKERCDDDDEMLFPVVSYSSERHLKGSAVYQTEKRNQTKPIDFIVSTVASLRYAIVDCANNVVLFTLFLLHGRDTCFIVRPFHNCTIQNTDTSSKYNR